MKEGGIFKADAEYNERKNKNGVYRDKMKVLLFLSEMIIPLILFYIVGFGILMKCDIYEEFVKARQKYFTPGQEWLEAELPQEKISVYMDKAQLEKDLDELVKTSLMYGKVRNLEMKIQVKKKSDGAELCYSDNGSGNWRDRNIFVSGRSGRSVDIKRNFLLFRHEEPKKGQE